MGRSNRRKRRARNQARKARQPRQAETAPKKLASEPISDRTANQLARSLPLGFLAAACLAVVGVLSGICAYSLSMHAAAQSWPAVPCAIVRNDYETAARFGRHGFRLEYEYTFNGRTYRSHELDLILGEIGDEAHYRRRLARGRPEGTQSVCYVNPADPSSAVLDREHMEALWVLPLLGLPFLVGGLAMGTGAMWPLIVLLLGDAAAGRLLMLCGLWGIVAGALFLFWLLEGPAHVTWAFYPASQQRPGVVLFVGDTRNQFFGFTQQQFEYAYEVDGRAYEGECYAYWTKLRADDTAPVQYDPAAPERSYLVGTTPTWSPAILAWLVLGFALPIAVACISALFGRASPTPGP